MTSSDDEMRRSACFDGHHRLSLTRHWGNGPHGCVIGCNPSTADALKDDATSRWWNTWFREAGFGGYDAVNLYPFCTSSPSECRRMVAAMDSGLRAPKDIRFVNLAHVSSAAKSAAQVFVCWGSIAWDADWIKRVVDEVQTGREPHPDLWCWGQTLNGEPKHALARGADRIPKGQPAILWRAA